MFQKIKYGHYVGKTGLGLCVCVFLSEKSNTRMPQVGALIIKHVLGKSSQIQDRSAFHWKEYHEPSYSLCVMEPGKSLSAHAYVHTEHVHQNPYTFLIKKINFKNKKLN